jgi:hypothetical protein
MTAVFRFWAAGALMIFWMRNPRSSNEFGGVGLFFGFAIALLLLCMDTQ